MLILVTCIFRVVLVIVIQTHDPNVVMFNVARTCDVEVVFLIVARTPISM